MKIIRVDFSKRGKDVYYYKKVLRQEQKCDIDAKIDRIITYQNLEARGRLLTKGDADETKKETIKNKVTTSSHKKAL